MTFPSLCWTSGGAGVTYAVVHVVSEDEGGG